MKIEDILVPIDFSPTSLRAVNFAVSLAGPEGEICLLHVIDSGFVSRLSDEGFGEPDAAIGRLRKRSEERLEEVTKAVDSEKVQLESMVVVGTPFAEILRVAADLDFQAIVMGTRGLGGENIEELLFGTTAEKVLRAARIPVICIPAS
ncbi:MAG TPA: universal stress protein [Blastocatellia bacterium]|nr:universal stress protein [Blastocatellia bacterium]